MTIAAIREELHHMIDVADERKLQAIHMLLETDQSDGYSKEELSKFYSTLSAYESGQMNAINATVVHDRIREKIAARK